MGEGNDQTPICLFFTLIDGDVAILCEIFDEEMSLDFWERRSEGIKQVLFSRVEFSFYSLHYPAPPPKKVLYNMLTSISKSQSNNSSQQKGSHV